MLVDGEAIVRRLESGCKIKRPARCECGQQFGRTSAAPSAGNYVILDLTRPITTIGRGAAVDQMDPPLYSIIISRGSAKWK